MKLNIRHFLCIATALAIAVGAVSCKKGGNPVDGGGEEPGDVVEGSSLADITYQLNVYSFADSDGDGWGDLKGVTQHLDYLADLGVSAVWLSPVQASMSYHGYDVTDYNSINPKLGTEADFKELIDKAGEKGIDIYMDFVLNHSGSDHEWFRKACEDPSSPYREYYVFSNDPNTDVSSGKVDNYAGASNPGMGTWYPLGGSSGRLHFVLDWNRKTVTVTSTQAAAQASNPAATRWIYYGNGTLAGLYETSPGIHEITVDFASDWGFLIRTSTSSWDNGTKWGGNGSALTLGKAYSINSNTAADITFSGNGYYFASFTRTMPDLNYGKYADAASSPAFKDLATSADKWINLGINGMRLDAVRWIYQDVPGANAAFLKAWYDRCNATYKARGGKGDFYVVGEAWTDGAEKMAPYYKGLPSFFNFFYWYTLKDRINGGKGNDFARTVLYFRNLFSAQRSGFIDAIKLSNHDESRAAEDLGKSVAKEKLAAAVLLTSPGKPYIYQGEELGYWGNQSGGDEYIRTPVKWTRSGSVPTAALGGKVDNAMLTADISVEAQSASSESLLSVYRKFAKARNGYKALASGEMKEVSCSQAAVALWTMSCEGQTVLVAHNFGSSSVSVTLTGYKPGKTLVSNGTVSADGSSLNLGPYSSAVFAL